MKTAEIGYFLKAKIEPLPDSIYGSRYRAAARLKDGTYLPCVVFQSERKQVELALKRFWELRKDFEGYRRVVGTFVAGRTSVAYWDIAEVDISPFAWPLSTLGKIHGETTMGWTAFVAEMSDGRCFTYGTSFTTEFFDLPPGYACSDIARIHSGMVYSESKGIQPFGLDRVCSRPIVPREAVLHLLPGWPRRFLGGRRWRSQSNREISVDSLLLASGQALIEPASEFLECPLQGSAARLRPICSNHRSLGSACARYVRFPSIGQDSRRIPHLEGQFPQWRSIGQCRNFRVLCDQGSPRP